MDAYINGVLLLLIVTGILVVFSLGWYEWLKMRRALRWECTRSDELIRRVRDLESDNADLEALNVYLEVKETCVLLYGLDPSAVEAALRIHFDSKGYETSYECLADTVTSPTATLLEKKSRKNNSRTTLTGRPI